MDFFDYVEFRFAGAVCTTVAGLFLSGVAYSRKPPDGVVSENREKAMAALKVIGPVVFGIGLLRFWMN